MAQSFYVPPANVFQAFQAGQQGYQQGQESLANKTLADLFKTASPDYKQAAGVLFSAGKPDQAFSLLKLANEQTANAQFATALGGFGGLGGGGVVPSSPTNAPPMSPMAAPPPAPPEVPPTPANPLGRRYGEVPPSSTIMGDREGVEAGIYDPPSPQRGRIAPPVAAPVVPQASAQAAPLPMGRPALPPGFVGALGNSSLGQGQRQIGLELLKHALDADKNPDIQKYNLYRQQGGGQDFTTWYRENKRSGAVTEADAFNKEISVGAGKRWNSYIEQAGAAQNKLTDITTMREVSRRMGSQGAAAGVKEALGPYAEALGINVSGLSDIQTFSSVVQRLAPQNRVPGTGSTSDIEFKGMLRSMPSLALNPGAREAILNTLEADARLDVAKGQIAAKLSAGELTREQAERSIRTLGDPMEHFRAWRKANPDAYGNALKSGGAPPPPASPGPAPTPQQRQTTGAPTATGPNGQKLILDTRTNQWVPAGGS
jgi:hypothetical protein